VDAVSAPGEPPEGERADPAERLAAIRRRIAAACERAGREPSAVTLVGASKLQPATALAPFLRAGLLTLGENRVQEALAKRRELEAIGGLPPIEWHLIGPLQSNKVRAALDLFTCIHSLDRPAIAAAIDQEAARRGGRGEGGKRGAALTGFLEVNLGEEPSKHGFAPGGLAEAARPLAALANLRIVGLMAIPPLAEPAGVAGTAGAAAAANTIAPAGPAAPAASAAPAGPAGQAEAAARRWFRRLRELRDELGSRPEWAGWPGCLSMGMSDDFELAVEEGATHVRIGTALFGPRRPPG
jgi:PLP dependent protein